MYKLIISLFAIFLLSSCISFEFAQETHFDLYRNSNGGYSFNYLQPRKLGQGLETKQNLKNWTSAYRHCQNYKIVNKRSSMNYYIINGKCI
ncbi:MAG: hypothetical protein HOM96_05025 [Rickettsiales bacterium]|jgi:hypothetical protein|nr:hypothetical protein [Rickettsiales bacterium]